MLIRELREALRWSIPSALTMGALLSGLSAVRFASEADFDTSVICVVMAAVLDGLDGHVARYLGSCSRLGFELDSLCDLANFGVSPALIVYFWAKALPVSECRSEKCRLDHLWLWAACCAYTACCAFRLARFNVAGHAEEMDRQHLAHEPGIPRPPVKKAVLHNFRQRKMYFRGVPAPVAAAYALTPLMLHFCAESLGATAWALRRRGAAGALVLTAMLMVSPLPTFSSKMLKTDSKDTHLQSRHVSSLAAKLGSGVLLCFLFWQHPFGVVLVCNFLHLASIPVSLVVFCLIGTDKSD